MDTVNQTSELDEIVITAAKWYATHPLPVHQPSIPVLREKFGLTALQACQAVKEATLIRVRSL